MDAVVVAVLMHNKVIIERIWQPEKPRNMDTNPSISAGFAEKKLVETPWSAQEEDSFWLMTGAEVLKARTCVKCFWTEGWSVAQDSRRPRPLLLRASAVTAAEASRCTLEEKSNGLRAGLSV